MILLAISSLPPRTFALELPDLIKLPLVETDHPLFNREALLLLAA